MTVLNGDKIEHLLWESGFDFYHRTGLDGFSSIEITVGDATVSVSETWQAEDDWHLDTDTLVFEKFVDGDLIDESYEEVDDEAALVDYVAVFGG